MTKCEERKFDDFNEYAKEYRDIHNKSIKLSGAKSDYYSEYKILQILKYEESNQTLRILDFGCGDGNSSVYLRKYFPEASIIGVDVSEESVNIAKNRNLNNSIFTTINGEKLPFKEAYFDIVFTSMVFHHIDFKLHEGILNDLYRVLKREGRFYTFEHNPNNPLTRKVVRDCEFDKNAVLLRPSYNISIIKSSGLKTDKLCYTLFLPRYKIFKIFLGVEKFLTWLPIGAQYYIRAIK